MRAGGGPYILTKPSKWKTGVCSTSDLSRIIVWYSKSYKRCSQNNWKALRRQKFGHRTPIGSIRTKDKLKSKPWTLNKVIYKKKDKTVMDWRSFQFQEGGRFLISVKNLKAKQRQDEVVQECHQECEKHCQNIYSINDSTKFNTVFSILWLIVMYKISGGKWRW